MTSRLWQKFVCKSHEKKTARIVRKKGDQNRGDGGAQGAVVGFDSWAPRLTETLAANEQNTMYKGLVHSSLEYDPTESQGKLAWGGKRTVLTRFQRR